MKKEELKHLAKLSRIKLTDKELEKFAPQMGTILESVDVLKEVNVDGVKAQSFTRVSLKNLREDKPKPSLKQEDVLKNAKYTEGGMIKVFGSLVEGSDA